MGQRKGKKERENEKGKESTWLCLKMFANANIARQHRIKIRAVNTGLV